MAQTGEYWGVKNLSFKDGGNLTLWSYFMAVQHPNSLSIGCKSGGLPKKTPAFWKVV